MEYKKREKAVEVNAESIKRMIATTGATQSEVSRILGFADRYLPNALSVGKMALPTIEKLAIYLRVPAETLYTPETEEKGNDVKEETMQAVLLSMKQLHDAMKQLHDAVKQLTESVEIMSDEVSAMKADAKNYHVNTSKTLEKIFNQVRYDPTKAQK